MTRRHPLLILTALAAGTLTAAGVPAPPGSDHGPGHRDRHAMADTRDAVRAQAERRFDALDTDRNGILTEAERRAARTARGAERFRMLDTDRDGRLSLAEFQARRDDHRPPRHGGRDRMGGSGNVSRADFMARPLARFDRLDADRDGRLSQAERAAARKARHRHSG